MSKQRILGTLVFLFLTVTTTVLIIYGATTDPVVPKEQTAPLQVGVCDSRYVSMVLVEEAVERLRKTTDIRFGNRPKEVVCGHRIVLDGDVQRTVPWKPGYVVLALRDQSYGDYFADQTIHESAGIRSWATVLVPEELYLREGYPAEVKLLSYMHGLAHGAGYGHVYLPIGPMRMEPKGHLMNPNPKLWGFTTRGMQ